MIKKTQMKIYGRLRTRFKEYVLLRPYPFLSEHCPPFEVDILSRTFYVAYNNDGQYWSPHTLIVSCDYEISLAEKPTEVEINFIDEEKGDPHNYFLHNRHLSESEPE